MRKYRNRAALLAALIILLAAVLPCGALAAKTGTVKGGWLILRASPSFSGKIISSYPSGTVVTITGPRPFFPGSILSQMYSTAPFRTNITPTKDVLFQRLK